MLELGSIRCSVQNIGTKYLAVFWLTLDTRTRTNGNLRLYYVTQLQHGLICFSRLTEA